MIVCEKHLDAKSEGGGGWDFNMKGVGMLIFSLRNVNFGFLSHFGCLGKTPSICSIDLRVSRKLVFNISL